MNPQTIKDSIQAVIDGLTPLAQKLQIPIQYLWIWCEKNNYAVAASEISCLVISLIAIFPLKAFWKFALKKQEESRYSDWHIGATFATVIFGVFLLSSLAAVIFGAVPRIVAPEYHTAQDLMSLVRGNGGSN